MIEFHKDKCTGCQVCPKVCPHRVISMEAGKAEGANIDKCIECGACSFACPARVPLVQYIKLAKAQMQEK